MGYVLRSKQEKNLIINALNRLSETGVFKILKQQQVTKDTYSAYHIDISYKGVRGEIQIHDPQSFLESVVNHEIRADQGEKPKGIFLKEKKLNAKAADKMPDQQAIVLAKGLEEQRKQEAAT